MDKPLPIYPLVAKAQFSRVIEEDADSPPSQFTDRYQNGETKEVWQEMRVLDGAIGKGALWGDVCQTVRRTMERVLFHIETIVDRLRCLGYEFSQPAAAHTQPADEILANLDELEQDFGSVPLSLRLFYKVVEW